MSFAHDSARSSASIKGYCDNKRYLMSVKMKPHLENKLKKSIKNLTTVTIALLLLSLGFLNYHFETGSISNIK